MVAAPVREEKHVIANDRLIVAVDTTDVTAALDLLAKLEGTINWVKVGLSLFTLGGPGLVKTLVQSGYNVFLDLKLHDIPHQVELAVENMKDLGVKLATVHTGGGPAMMEAAVKAAGDDITILGVTVLTSMDHHDLVSIGYTAGFFTEVAKVVYHRAETAKSVGVPGVICSPNDAVNMAKLGFAEIVTPGIRMQIEDAPFKPTDTQDQKRVNTPTEAIRNGATRLVVGRAITQAEDPCDAAQKVLEAIRAA